MEANDAAHINWINAGTAGARLDDFAARDSATSGAQYAPGFAHNDVYRLTLISPAA